MYIFVMTCNQCGESVHYRKYAPAPPWILSYGAGINRAFCCQKCKEEWDQEKPVKPPADQ